MSVLEGLDKRFLTAFEELGSKANTTRKVEVEANSHGFALVNPVDWQRALSVTVIFDLWNPPSQGKDGDFIGWSEQWLWVDRRKQWMRVVRVDNNSDDRVSMIVKLSSR